MTSTQLKERCSLNMLLRRGYKSTVNGYVAMAIKMVLPLTEYFFRMINAVLKFPFKTNYTLPMIYLAVILRKFQLPKTAQHTKITF